MPVPPILPAALYRIQEKQQLELYDDLAEVRAARHVTKSLFDFRERKYLIYDGFDPMHRNGPGQVLEHLA